MEGAGPEQFGESCWRWACGLLLGFGVPYFNTFFLKGTNMKYKFILFSPWLLKSPVYILEVSRVISKATIVISACNPNWVL